MMVEPRLEGALSAAPAMGRPVVLDLPAVSLTRDGVEGFFWPVALHEVTALRNRFTPDLVRIVRSARAQEQSGATATMLLSHLIVMEVMALFQAQLLAERLRGRDIVWPADSRLWMAIAEDKQPAPAPLIGRLRRGPSRRSAPLERIAPFARRYLSGRAATHLRFSASCPRSGIVTTRFTDPLIRRHAEQEVHPVTHVHHSYWLKACKIDVSGRHGGPAIVDAVIAAAEDSFATLGNKLTAVSRRYLREFLIEAILLVQLHLDRLRSGRRILPEQLWTGSAGNIWDRLLRQATRERGGQVCGHDHATGSGHINNPWNYFLEFVSTDRFVTDHPAKADAARRQADPALMFCSKLPEIQVVDTGHSPVPATSTCTRPRRIMYVSTLYGGESLHLLPLPADIVVVDWQARLLAQLAEWGFDVLHKPHPDGKTPPPALARIGRYERLDAPFEKTWNSADLLLFDYPSSTTFGFAMQTTKPIVLIDTGQFDWLPAAAEDLRARCAVVTARFDKDNRLTTDWQALQEAIVRAPLIAGNTAFREHFLGG